MAVPDFQTMMLPILECFGDGQIHTDKDVQNWLIDYFALTEDDVSERLPSGAQSRLYNRVSWSRYYLQQSGLLEKVGRNRFQITQRGVNVLTQKPTRIDMRFLEQFPEYIEFRQRKKSRTGSETTVTEEVVETDATPEEALEASYQSLRAGLADELLERIKSLSPRFFERLVIDLLVAMGYGGSRVDAGQAVGRSGDEGIDGIIKEDKLGLDVIYVQAKRWQNTVGRPEIQGFAGSLEGQRARKGIFITTSNFAPSARDYVSRIEKKIVLIDGQELAELMIDYGIGVSQKAVYVVKRIDEDYFNED